jgi:glucan phosphoethanolaminetransferase (alkaline phosphatase superfamily)
MSMMAQVAQMCRLVDENKRKVNTLGSLIGVFVILDGTLGVSRFFSNLQSFAARSVFKGIAYVMMLGFLTGASLLLLKARSRLLSGVVLALYAASTVLECGFKVVSRRGFTGHWVERTIHEIRFAPAILQGYFTLHSAVVIGASIIAWGMLFALLRRQELCGRNLGARAVAGLMGAVIAISFVAYLRFGDFSLHPITLRATANVVNHYVHSLLRVERDLVAVSTVAGQATVASALVLVIDESVGGGYLSLNGHPVDTTPYLRQTGSRLLNYGVASSGATCSYPSNNFLATFVRLEDVTSRQAIERRQTIYYYAKKAGFRTAFLSAQTRTPVFYGIVASDLVYIDDVVLVEETNSGPEYLNDYILVEELRKLLTTHRDEKIFALVQKLGAHVPYDPYYPAEARVFGPVLAGRPVGVEHQAEAVNSYYNGLRYAVDGFYQKLDTALEGTETVLLYTSDHGQNLDFSTTKRTHCGAARIMAEVPLWLDVRGEQAMRRLRERFGPEFERRNHNHASHFNVFPTLLTLMNVGTDEATLFDDLSNQARRYCVNAKRFSYRRLPFDVHE